MAEGSKASPGGSVGMPTLLETNREGGHRFPRRTRGLSGRLAIARFTTRASAGRCGLLHASQNAASDTFRSTLTLRSMRAADYGPPGELGCGKDQPKRWSCSRTFLLSPP
jgi:hypothetical protein